MGHQHGLDRRVSPQRLFHLCRIHRDSPAKLQQLHLYPQAPHGIGPAMAKDTCHQDQRLIPAREDVGINRLPSAMAVADIARNMARRPRKGAQIRPKPRHHIHQRASIDIGRGPLHGGQNSVWQNRRAGNGQIGPALGQGHEEISFGATARPCRDLGQRARRLEVAPQSR